MNRRPPSWTTFADTDLRSFSFARVSSAVLLLATIGWTTYIVIYTKHIPDLTSVALIFGAIYGIPKVTESGVMNPQQTPPENPPPNP